MIRWDQNGDHIIVERPEQLALHVLPSVYRQSRFASFSRQLNIYGFMRKVNLRNVDPAIDDPDASTWSHATLNRNSPPDVVANFKRRVPPRLPKPRRKTESELPIPTSGLNQRSSMGITGVPLAPPTGSAGSGASQDALNAAINANRARSNRGGFTGSPTYPPLNPPTTTPWGAPNTGGYLRQALPPLTVPSDPPPHQPHSAHGMYNQHHHHAQHGHSLHSLTPQDENPPSGGPGASYGSSPSSYPYTSAVGSYAPTHQYSVTPSDTSTSSWGFPSISSSTSSHSSLSSLLNPSSGASSYSHRSTMQPGYQSSAPPPFSAQSPVSLSPDSRPNTGYSVASNYDNSRPGSSHHHIQQHGLPPHLQRPLTPSQSGVGSGRPSPKAAYAPTSLGTPGSSGAPNTNNSNTGPGGSSSLSIRRARRHSQAMSPYPSPYDSDGRPMTAPGSPSSISRGASRSTSNLVHQTSSGDNYGYAPAQAEFAYSAGHNNNNNSGAGGSDSPSGSVDATMASGGWLPSTSTGHATGASHESSVSATNTPPMMEQTYPETDIHRFSPQFGIQQLGGGDGGEASLGDSGLTKRAAIVGV
ncbi:hypothetical protein SISNIDRAFT_188257 [Sistotremastrum niveocremeum HHB9708]|uniref:HSF-type DNA-binding domain-containing protein n=1 Tax=Sistotremastrum niveocremeum HHB9708 TaxID=1314777 RepID=A0A164Z3T7_9AGAM|nr:hypothetical protein SISNIDRAFT_188257 [Sistotremastrum niveocremeum HHB9708]